jgi:hypothetical protein
MIVMNNKHEVFECKICNSHYLTIEGVEQHLEYRHEIENWTNSDLIEKVPFGATEFD